MTRCICQQFGGVAAAKSSSALKRKTDCCRLVEDRSTYHLSLPAPRPHTQTFKYIQDHTQEIIYT
jgi:hypothetical protein